jgi:hypothetical protein
VGQFLGVELLDQVRRTRLGMNLREVGIEGGLGKVTGALKSVVAPLLGFY